MAEPTNNQPGAPLDAVSSTDLAGSPIVLVRGLAGVTGIDELAAAFGSEDLGFRRRWDWRPGEDGSGLAEATLDIEFGEGSRRWRIAVRFGPDWPPESLIAIASGQLFSLADADRPPPPLGQETDLVLPLMLDIDTAFLGAAGETVGGTLELCVCIHRFEEEDRAIAGSERAAKAMGPLGFVWRLREGTPDGPAAFLLVAVVFSRPGAERADDVMRAAGGTLIEPAGGLRHAIEGRLWPGVEEGAASAAGDGRTGRRGGLVLTPEGFEPFGPEVA